MKKKKSIVLIVLSFFISGFLQAQSDADQAYIKAMQANSPAQRAQLLKEFIAKYGGKGSQYENYAYANLCLIPYPGKTEREIIDYGEKAIALGGLDELVKCQVLVIVSGLYSKLGQNLDRARNYASQAIEISRTNRGRESETGAASAQWNQWLGAGYYALGEAQEKAKDNKSAIDSFINSYNILKNPQILNKLKKVGRDLYEFHMYNDAEKVFKFVYQNLKDAESLTLYANTLYRSGKQEEALAFFKEVYGKHKSGEMAYNIGIILAKKASQNPALSTEAIRYLLDASFLYPSKSQQAMSLAENLFFSSDTNWNRRVKEIQDRNKKIEEIVKTYNTKFEGKNEDELSESQKKEMKALQDKIEIEKKSIQNLEAEQKTMIDKFNRLIEETKQRLGVK